LLPKLANSASLAAKEGDENAKMPMTIAVTIARRVAIFLSAQSIQRSNHDPVLQYRKSRSSFGGTPPEDRLLTLAATDIAQFHSDGADLRPSNAKDELFLLRYLNRVFGSTWAAKKQMCAADHILRSGGGY
jgi:hypothetical protein